MSIADALLLCCSFSLKNTPRNPKTAQLKSNCRTVLGSMGTMGMFIVFADYDIVGERANRRDGDVPRLCYITSNCRSQSRTSEHRPADS